jgi:hypothetical protein
MRWKTRIFPTLEFDRINARRVVFIAILNAMLLGKM